MQFSFHLFAVSNEVRRDITTIKLHTFYYINCSISTLCFFNSDNTFFTNFSHCISNQFTNNSITVSRNSCYLFNLFVVVTNCLRLRFQVSNNFCYSLVDTSFQIHWISASSYILQTFTNDRLSQHSCSSSTITCNISSFRSYFFHHLRPHVFNWVVQFNFFSYRNTIFSYLWCTEFFFYNHITTFWSQCYFYSVCQCVNAFFHFVSCFDVEENLLCHFLI